MYDAIIKEKTPHRTKIVATIGPASHTSEVLHQLIEAGVDVFRLNFSHGTHQEHSAVLAQIRELSRKLDRHVAVLQDLCGPKMRLGSVPGGMVECPLGEEFTLVAERSSDSPRELTCSYCELPKDLKPGEIILFADGAVAMSVIDAAPGKARLKVTLAGCLRSHQGLNLPGSDLAVNSLTGKDLLDLDWTARHAADIDFVGLSFVRGPNDVAALRQELQSRRCPARIVVKIEKHQAVLNLEAIIAASFGVMVARGDLGVEMEVQQVPAIQKRIIALCNQAHRPVITATQMLNSMEHSGRPTRAEATDVFNAVIDGTDAVMLSGESAVGEYPVQSAITMRQICAEAEAYLESACPKSLDESASLTGLIEPITEAAVDAAHLITRRLHAPLIVVATGYGRTALALSNRRPTASILALTHTEGLARALALCWGVTPLLLEEVSTSERELAYGIEWAKAHSLVRAGQHAVLLRGQLTGHPTSRAVLAREVT
jgi:pyruvate kinase